MPVIYKITSPSEKVYIGQTWNWAKRKSNYRRLNNKGQIVLYNSLVKYGFDNHIIEIQENLIENCTQEELDDREIYWWKYYKDLGFKMLNLKEPGKGGKHSQESINKMIGKSPSQETRNKISKTLTGKKLSKEHCQNLSKSRIGRKVSQKSKDRFNEYLKTRVISKESIEKMRKTLTGRKLSSEHVQKLRNRFKKEIIILTLDGKFVKECNNSKEVASFLNLKMTNGVTTALLKKQKSVNNHQVIYKKDYDPTNPPTVSLWTSNKILQYDLSGKFLNEYKNAKDAERAIGICGANVGIGRCCKLNRNNFHEYMWRYKINN